MQILHKSISRQQGSTFKGGKEVLPYGIRKNFIRWYECTLFRV